MFETLQPHELQHARLPYASLYFLYFPIFPWVCSNSCPLSQWYHPTISSSVAPFSFCPWRSPASGSFPVSQLFTSRSLSIRPQLQHQPFQWIFRVDFLQGWLVLSPCSPRDSQESSPTSQFKSINSLALSFLYGPPLTSIHDDWKNHSFDSMDICWQKWCLCLLICSLGMSYFFFQGVSIF